MKQADAEGISISDGEDYFLLRGKDKSQSPRNRVNPAMGTGEPVAFPRAEGLTSGAAYGGAPHDIPDFKTEFVNGFYHRLMIHPQPAA